MAGCDSSSDKPPVYLEGNRRERLIREHLLWLCRPREPRPRLLIEDWILKNPHTKPKRKWP